jgi:hypothetical protein
MPACTGRRIYRSTRIMIRRPRDPECPESKSSVIFQSGSAIRTDAGMGFR